MIMIQRKAIFCVLSILLSLGVLAQFEAESFDQIDRDKGLSSSVITCMLKDSRGFMWFGTQDGLNKYDGYSFTIYKHNDSVQGSISGNYILSLLEDNSGNIWIGTENNGLNRYDRYMDSFVVYKAEPGKKGSLSSNSIRDAVQASDGKLLFGTDKGISVYNGYEDQFSSLLFQGEDTIIGNLPTYYLYADTNNSMWIGTSNGLYHYEEGGKQIYRYFHDPEDDASLSNNFVNSIYRSTKGLLYIGTNRGLNIFNSESETFESFYFDESDPLSKSNNEVQAITEDRRGNLWVGSFGGGLIKFNIETGQSAVFTNDPDDQNSLSNNHVYSLLSDDAGILWVGTYGGGINKIDQVRIRFDLLEADPTDPNSLASNEVYSILPMGNDVWFGTDKGITIWNRQENTFSQTLPVEGSLEISTGPVYSMIQDSQKNIWIGTASNGVHRLVPSDTNDHIYLQFHYSENGDGNRRIVSDEILCFYEDNNEQLWIGSLNGISILRDGHVVTNFENDPQDPKSIADNEVYSIQSDLSGSIWIGTFMGLNRFNAADSSFTYYKDLLGPGKEVNSIYCIHRDSQGFLWLGTDNSGLIKFDPASEKMIRQYSASDNLPDNVIYAIVEDEEKNLWLSSNNGIIKAMHQSGSSSLNFIHYNSNNWLNTNSFNISSFARSSDGTIYFGSFDGVSYFHPENVKGNILAPPVYITDFQLFFEPVPISMDGSTPLSKHISETGNIKLSHDQNVLKFSFAALNFIQPENNSYAFRMENLEEQWNYVNDLREAQYMYIPPGEYIFHVKATNNDGVWNETGASIRVTITPPFTQTIWFYIIVIVIITVIVLWVINQRTRNLRAARTRLEKQVQVRTQELRSTNQNLESEIKERQKVQEALVKSEARFRQLIETMNEGFSVQDQEGKINYVNPKLCTMIGENQQEIIGKSPLDFIDNSSPKWREEFIFHTEKATKSGNFYSFEMNWKRKDGTIFTAMVSPKPIFDAENTFTGSVAVLTDITDLKNAEKQLINKNEDLNEAMEDLKKTQAQLIDSEKMASLGQLTAGVAHEINNPINFVSGNVLPLRRDIEDILEVLKKYDQITEQLKLRGSFEDVDRLKEEIDFDFLLSEIDNLLDGIGEGANRTAEIVKGLRNFSRMDEHELKMANINQGLDSTLLILHNKIKNRIDIQKEYGEFPDIMCYPGQLNQVFMNLLNNAQESIDNEGLIWIKTWKDNKQVHVSIKDSGRGIPAKLKKKIFDPFFTTKDVGKGTGLGLSISFGIIEKHNGTIKVNSEKGEGTEFIVSIPDNLT